MRSTEGMSSFVFKSLSLILIKKKKKRRKTAVIQTKPVTYYRISAEWKKYDVASNKLRMWCLAYPSYMVALPWGLGATHQVPNVPAATNSPTSLFIWRHLHSFRSHLCLPLWRLLTGGTTNACCSWQTDDNNNKNYKNWKVSFPHLGTAQVHKEE